MTVIVNTNVQSLVAQKNLSSSTNALNTATQRLSTGMRINQASDDAAGLYIAKGIESQLRGSQQCQNNIALGVNVLQIAEGDLSTIQDNVMRIKDLATQAANGINSTDARNAMANEVQQRVNEINRISSASNFNGTNLLDGSNNNLSSMRLQVGAGSDSSANAIFVNGVFTKSDAQGIGLVSSSNTYSTDAAGNTVSSDITANFASATAAATFIKTCSDTLTNISTKRANIGVVQNRLQAADDGLATTIQNLSAAKSTVMDTDIAATTADYTKNQILQQISASMLSAANQAPSIALSLIH